MNGLQGKAIIGLGSDKKCLYCIMRLICFRIELLTREPFGKTESRPPELSSFSPDIMMIKIKAMITNVKVMMRMMLVKMRMRTSNIKHLYNRPSLRLLLSF